MMSTSSSADSNLQNVQNLDISNEKVVFGIDLGTIQTRVAIVKHEDNSPEAKPKIVASIPSVVSYTKNVKCLVGPCAERRIVSSARHTFHATKCLIGRSYDDPVISQFERNIGYDIFRLPDGQPSVMSTNSKQILTPGHIATLLFLKVKELCQEELKKPMENVVITIPDHFTENQIQSTKEAAQMAGLNVLKMISEPIAAVYAYHRNEIDDKTFVVYDFGGTFKVSVLGVRNGKLEVKSTAHDIFLGCDDFDNVLVNYFVENLRRMTRFDVSENLISMQWLKKAAQNAQIDLCYSTELDIFFYCICRRGNPKRISIKLTRSKFEELVAEFINKTIPLCHKALEDAKVAVSDIDEVFAIGGVSRIPKVRATVQEIFNKVLQPGEGSGDRINCVAFGAAIIGKNISFNITDDEVAFAQVPPQFLKPVEETEEFNYHIADDLYDDNFMDKLYAEVVATGIFGILTEEEADNRITHQYRTSPNLDQSGDVNFIPAYQHLLALRRSGSIVEKEIPDELEAQIDRFRKGRDDFVMEELCRTYTARL